MIRAVVALALAGGCVDDGGPRMTALIPATATPGAVIEIDGERFCGPKGDCVNLAASIELDAQPSVIDLLPVTWSSNLVDAQIAAGSPTGTFQLVMTVDGRSSNALSLVVQ